MKHSNDGGVLKGAHEYKKQPDGTMGYQEVKDFKPSQYPKHVEVNGHKAIVKDEAEEQAFHEKHDPKPVEAV